MYDESRVPIKRFDDLFNDDFIEIATEEEMELRFDYLRQLCERDDLKMEDVIEELEFYCNSFIADVVGA